MGKEGLYVLFICGGKWQLPWMNYLKAKGHRILLVDPYTTSPCVPGAAVHMVCDARDVDGIFAHVKEGGYEIEFVTSDQTDVSTQTVAALSTRLGTRGNPPPVVKIFSNKFENRQFLQRSFSGHFPAFCQARTVGEVKDFYATAGQDIMIKPPDAQSSRGVFRINSNSIAQIDRLFLEAKHHSNQEYIIAERFLAGKEITVEGICVGHHHTTLAISDKKHFRTGIASELRYPAVLNDKLHDQLIKFHNEFVGKTGLEFGITHSEYIVSEDESDFWLVESACRGGGSLIPSHIVPWVSGVDVYDIFYKLSVGEPVPPLRQGPLRNAILHFFEFSSGLVTKVAGLEAARQMEGVIDIDFEFKEGDRIKAANDDRSRQGYVIVFGNTADELNHRLQRVVDTVNVTIEP